MLDWDFVASKCEAGKKKSPRTSSDILDVGVEHLSDFCIFLSNPSLSFQEISHCRSTRKSVQANASPQKGEGPAKASRLLVVHQKWFGDPCGLIDFNAVYSCYLLYVYVVITLKIRLYIIIPFYPFLHAFIFASGVSKPSAESSVG